MNARLPRLRVRGDLAGPLLIALIAVAARLPGVYDEPFWEDEVASARILREPTFTGMLHHVARTESTPPLWYALGWLVHRAGVSLRDERLLSVAFGAVFAGLAVVLARRFVARTPAIFAGVLVALGAEFVWHGHELRAYALFALLSSLFALCLLAELRAPSRRTEVALAATVAAGGLTHYFFAFSALAVLAWLRLDPAARAIRRGATVAIVAGGAAAASWAPVLLTGQYQPGRFWWIGPFRLRHVTAIPLRLVTPLYNGTTLGLVLSAATIAAIAYGSWRLASASVEGRAVVVLGVAPLVAAAAVWAGGMPIFDLRNLIGIGAFLAIAVAATVDALPRRVAAPAAVTISLLVALSFASTEAHRTPPYDTMALALVRAGWQGSEPIAIVGDVGRYRLPLEWYLPRQPLLTVGRPGRTRCTEVFLIRRGGAIARITSRDRGTSASTLRRATLLVARGHRPRCVRFGELVHPPKLASGAPPAVRQTLRVAAEQEH